MLSSSSLSGLHSVSRPRNLTVNLQNLISDNSIDHRAILNISIDGCRIMSNCVCVWCVVCVCVRACVFVVCVFFSQGAFLQWTTSRCCRNKPNSVCYICGESTLRAQRKLMWPPVRRAGEISFGCKVGDQDQIWAPDICCSPCSRILSGTSWRHLLSWWFGANLAITWMTFFTGSPCILIHWISHTN